MTGSLTLLLGGARGGKSTLAVQLARRSGRPVSFLATAEALDEEMVERVSAHQAERPSDWRTYEVPHGLVSALDAVDPESFVIVDCLTLWSANRLFAGIDNPDVVDEARRFATRAAAHPGGVVVVSNEVGLGIVPDNALSRTYRDLLGRVNAVVAERCERVFLVVAGRLLELQTPAEAWP